MGSGLGLGLGFGFRVGVGVGVKGRVRLHARLVQQQVALLYGLVVHEGLSPRLGDDACLAQLEQALGRVEGVRRVDDALAW